MIEMDISTMNHVFVGKWEMIHIFLLNELCYLVHTGSAIVRHHTTKLLLFWRTAFPRSMRELDQEKQRGDSFTWQLTLEARSGALCGVLL